jgi:glycosyltransferase involved in cell wall biosynthesis
MNEAFLQANSESYEWLTKKAQEIEILKHSETALSAIESAALFAMLFHPGRFADGSIENLAFKLGEELNDLVTEGVNFKLPVPRKDKRRRVLHVASHVLGIGGHTRMLYHWIQNDQNSCHSLVLVRQSQRRLPIPRWLAETIFKNGGDLISFPSALNLCHKAKWLREIAKLTADLVVLHHDGSDVVPTVAFADKDCPPIVVLNHSDHLFWLGSSISDMVINLRTVGADHSVKRRYVSSNTVIPIPLSYPTGQISREDARQELGIPNDQLVLLSIGRAEKYRPCSAYDFVSTANKILDRERTAHLYVVGESEAGISPYLRCSLHDRLHFVGSVEDPSRYRSAADIYLESFPFGSQTSVLEAALHGIPIVPAYAPLFKLLVANDDAIQDLLQNPHDEQEYLERVDLLIRDPQQRVALGESLRDRLLIDHVAEGWLDRLAALYRETDRLIHCPKIIPFAPCSNTFADISLSLWHVMADGKTNSPFTPEDKEEALICHKAFLAKFCCDFATARRFAWQAILINPYRFAIWRLFAVTLLGKGTRVLKWCFNMRITKSLK